ncbi:MAG: FtsW/RodA/SpoVE family cell cycle protein [Oscillospiraceae bacterium]|jgi:cell division protein FtsW (lipid II flippase)|nr:FtsW/RodA/SpoVE family cell cycle protein [Oscillospiraceae bacterium]
MQGLPAMFAQWETAVQAWLVGLGGFGDLVTFVTRFFFPLMTLALFLRCLWPLMSGGRRPKPWALAETPDGTRLPLVHWENAVGSGKNCDVTLDDPAVSRTHAVISRRRDGWYVTDMGSAGGTAVGGTPCAGTVRFEEGDLLTLAGVELTVLPVEGDYDRPRQRRGLSGWAADAARSLKPGVTLLYLLLFQLTALAAFAFGAGAGFSLTVPVAYLMFMALECLYFLFTRGRGRRRIEPELLAFFLCGIGLFVAAADPDSLLKQVGAIAIGLLLFLVLTFFLNNIDRARLARYVFAGGSVALLALNLLLGETRFGARNWLSLGPVSIQPSELVKVAFVFAGAASLEYLLTRRNLIMFLGFSGVCVGALGLMRDFGAAVIFFAGFLVMAFLRSGDARLLLVGLAVAAAGAFLAISIMPYIAARFAAWGNAWAFADTTGYQQTRTMIYTASGGLLGTGLGHGFLRHVAAADTDLVFGVVAEEWGLIVALACALAPLALAFFAATSVRAARSAFYAIAACGAAVILLTQTALNVFGSLDILPLTGVTLPFVSNGGSSMVGCWGLLACIKSIDERHRSGRG